MLGHHSTVARHWTSIGWMPRVCREAALWRCDNAPCWILLGIVAIFFHSREIISRQTPARDIHLFRAGTRKLYPHKLQLVISTLSARGIYINTVSWIISRLDIRYLLTSDYDLSLDLLISSQNLFALRYITVYKEDFRFFFITFSF